MELPHGVPFKIFNGPMPLAELNGALLKDAFTGVMRASLVHESFSEGVIIYDAGKPVIAYTSDGSADRPDREQKAIAPITENAEAVIELISFNKSQISLIMDFGKEFIIQPQAPPQPRSPRLSEAKPASARKAKQQEKPAALPEVRGTFVKSESSASLRSYVESMGGETGHIILAHGDGENYAEYHMLILKGKAVAAYTASSKEAGTALVDKLLDMGGEAEFYRVDDAIIQSILNMHPHVAVAEEPAPGNIAEAVPEQPKDAPKDPAAPGPQPMHVLRPDIKPFIPPTTLVRAEPVLRPDASAAGPAFRPAEKLKLMETHSFNTMSRQGIGVPTKSLLEKSNRQAHSVESGIVTPAPEPKPKPASPPKGDADEDIDYVKKIENEFVGNVDDLLKRLELSHLKVVPDKKKRP